MNPFECLSKYNILIEKNVHVKFTLDGYAHTASTAQGLPGPSLSQSTREAIILISSTIHWFYLFLNLM